MNKFIEATINSVLTLVNNAVVFLDDASAECFHWCNGLSKLLDAGALDIRDIKHTKECLESENKCVFIISTPINGQVSKYIQRIVKSSDFTHCIIVSSLSGAVNEFIHNTGSHMTMFNSFCQQLKLWMQNEFATVTLHHIPVSIIGIMTDFFITPTHNSLFPILPSDVARLQAFLYSRGDKRIFQNLGDVDVGFLPHNMQSQIKMLSSTLNSMFESMNIHEDCYAVGHFSRLVATELANMPDARGRRKIASTRTSIVFVDRTLDLVAPISHTSDCVLGTIYEILPHLKNHNNDIAVDMKMLFADGNVTSGTLFPGCLAHTEDKEANDLLQIFVTKSKQDCIKYIYKKLKNVLDIENIIVKDVEDAATVSTLKTLLKYFKNNIQLFKRYSGVLQCSVALINALTDVENEHLEELLSAEKVILLDLASGEDDPFSQIQRLLSRKDNSRFSVVDALMFCLFIYSAGDDVSNASPAHEEKLKEALINILMDGNHKEDMLFIIGDLDASERQVRTRMADIFERLRGVGEARKEMQHLKSLFGKDDIGVMKYKPLIVQILEQIFDPAKPELADIEFRSHGFKDFLKTGFGFFMNVSKPRPDDHPIILFVVGGITWYEVKCIKETLKKLKPNQKVTIGSTRLLTPSDTLEQVLCSENLYVDVDT